MTFLAITGLINFLTSVLFGTFIFIKNPRGQQNRQFFYFSLSVGLYGLGYFLWQISHEQATALFWFNVLFIGIILINATLLHYVLCLVSTFNKKKAEIIVYYSINAIFIVLNLASFLYTGLEPRHELGLWPNPAMLFNGYLAFWVWEALYIFILLLRYMKKATGIKREQTKYTIVSGLIGFLGGASNWPMWFGIHFPPYANFLVATYVCLMGYAIARYQLLDIKVVLSRTGIFLGVYTLVLGIPFIIGFHTNFGFLSFVILFILATMGPVIYRYLQGKAENVILARQREYQKILHDSAKIILRVHNINRLGKLIMYGVNSVMKVEYAAIFLDDPEHESLRLVTASDSTVFPPEAKIGYDDPAVDLMRKFKKPVAHELVSRIFTSAPEGKFSMLVPSFNEDRLLGFMVLGDKADGSFYSADDINTFDILSHQTALAIENCLYIEERKKTQDRLFEAEKLALVGGMAEGVAHQIRNRLNHFSLAAMQIRLEIDECKGHTPDLMEQNAHIGHAFNALQEIAESIIDNVKKTNSVIKGILNFTFTNDNKNYFSGLSFREILEGAKDLVRIKHGIEDIPITLECDENDLIYGIMTQLMEAIYNLIDNAYEATNEKMKNHMTQEQRKQFNPFILVRLFSKPDSFLIEITDNGVGIADEDKKKIFAPYFTTKSSHKSKSISGIGLYVVHRMITENHKGKIWFTSEFMKGTSFFISLPIQVQGSQQENISAL
ncbi:MAG: GAF domain-containing protein [Spirochaetes bacterium]|nr:GAF domain-containing protein [Spirochaetota bacterium]